MVCPCCGGEMAPDGLSCACGARVVGPPLTEPDFIVQKIGGPLGALILAILSLSAFIWKWTLPFALLALWISRRALKQIKTDPRHYGGRRTARVALALSLLIIVGVAVYVSAGIPKYLRWRAESQRAATRAQMYKLAIALHEYKRIHGAYPVSLDSLQTSSDEPLVYLDHWDNRLKYQATAEVASDSQNEENQPAMLASFNQYRLVSPGPDGKLGTADDMVMQDDIIISPTRANISPDEESEE